MNKTIFVTIEQITQTQIKLRLCQLLNHIENVGLVRFPETQGFYVKVNYLEPLDIAQGMGTLVIKSSVSLLKTDK